MRTWFGVLLLALAVSLLPSGPPLTPPLLAGFDDIPQLAPEQPAGTLVMDRTTRLPAVGGMPVDFKRSPDAAGPDGKGRYLIAVNSGYGIQFSAATNGGQQSLAVIDLVASPAPHVIQNVYFPAPQSANVGVAFGPGPGPDGTYLLYVSGGVENKVWVFRFRPGVSRPIVPASSGPATTISAPFIDVSGLTDRAPLAGFNGDLAPVYPAGLAISPDGDTLFVAANLGDSLGIVRRLRAERALTKVDLRRQGGAQLIYPYGVVAVPPQAGSEVSKVYVSCWNDATIAVVDPRGAGKLALRIPVERHPTAMILNDAATRLYVANSNADTVSVIDTASDREIERINVRLTEQAPIGGSPEGLALGADGLTLFVANAHANAVAVVALSREAAGVTFSPHGRRDGDDGEDAAQAPPRSLVKGFVPAGHYPSAVAVAAGTLFVGNGKGTGVEPSSLVVNSSGRSPKLANDRFPAGDGLGGQYIGSLIVGNIGAVPVPDAGTLTLYTQQVLKRNGLVGERRTRLFTGPNPIRHVIYIIKENRTYDQVFGDIARAGDGSAADGDPSLAIFGLGEGARRPGGAAQRITPNQHALALRFGLLDRFFVNSEASPDGHNWSTAAFSSDYVDKAWRWEYSGRGRSYDYEGFNRLPSYEPPSILPPVFRLPITAEDLSGYMRRFIPYLNGSRDVAEPETLYLWDLAARHGVSYRSYGEFIGTMSAADIEAINAARRKAYPDTSATVGANPTKKTLEGHHSPTYRAFDMYTPDALTVESYLLASGREASFDPVVRLDHPDVRGRGYSRLADWLAEFQGYVDDLKAGRPDRLPQFSIMKLPCNHTSGLSRGLPTPQFMVAENDYAVGRLVEAVSTSSYWKDTAVFVLEDDAQDGPDHVDAHRSPALVISAYNRPGAFVHEFHNTVSLIRTMELLLGLPPMNLLDAAASPIDIFRDTPDLAPYRAVLPEVAPDNLLNPDTRASSATYSYFVAQTERQDLTRPDMANPRALNEIIWFSVRGSAARMPAAARLPVFDAMQAGIRERAERAPARPAAMVAARR
jgi:YVTN family beta-propeller protein